MSMSTKREGFTQRSHWYPNDLLAEIEYVIARMDVEKTPGHMVLYRRALKYTDRETGQEKEPAAILDWPTSMITVSSGQTRIRFNQFLQGAKPFSAYLNIHQFTHDEPLRYAMDRFPVMLWLSGVNGEHLHANPALQYYTGCAPVDFKDGGYIKVIHPEDQGMVLQICADHFRTRQPVRFPYRIWHYSGRWGKVYDYAEPRYRPDGSYAGFIGTMRLVDIPVH